MSIEGAVRAAEENVIWTTIQRHKKGLLVKVKVAAEVEEFFKAYSGGVERVTDYGAAWQFAREAQPVLRAWSYTNNNPALGYDLNTLGGQLLGVNDPRNGKRYTNISFLRLCGASEGEGISFVLDTIISRPEMEKLSNDLTAACGAFYADFIKPIQFDIQINCVPSSSNPTYQMPRT